MLPQLPVLVPQVAVDPALKARAAALAETRILDLVTALGQHQERTNARVSDAGRCALELWSFLHGLHNIPDDGANMIAKMDNGTMFGWWLAALEAIAIEEWFKQHHPDRVVTFEYEKTIAYRGVVPGHFDLGVSVNDKPWWLIENKSTYSSFPLSPPHLHAPYQPLQAATYASEGGFPNFSILTIGPAVQGKWDKDIKARIEPPKLLQSDYKTDEWAARAEAEMNRLVDIASADEEHPDLDAVWRVRNKDGKPVEAWRCKYCRYGACSKNENPLRLLVE